MINNFPIWLIVIDYLFASLMIILMMKFILNIFLSEGSNFLLVRLVNKIVYPVFNITYKITPNFIVRPIIPLYIVWLIFMVRLYVLPLCLGYSYQGKFAFIFEKDLILQLKSLILGIALNLNYGI